MNQLLIGTLLSSLCCGTAGTRPNPSCACSHGYSCPVLSAENRLTVAIPVGVQEN